MLTLDMFPDDIVRLLKGEPASLVGSNIALKMFGLPGEGADYDAFVGNTYMMGRLAAKAEQLGFELPERDAKIQSRWSRFGIKGWHTNSIHFISPAGDELNVINKSVGGTPVQGLGQVLESFDFGHLAGGFDMELGVFKDFRRAHFEDYFETVLGKKFQLDGAYPLMPEKNEAWKKGFISQYNGIRQLARYSKHHGYGFDMSLVTDTLIQGYYMSADYWGSREGTPGQEVDWATQSSIYRLMAEKLEVGDHDDIKNAVAKIDYVDTLDAIMEALE